MEHLYSMFYSYYINDGLALRPACEKIAATPGIRVGCSTIWREAKAKNWPERAQKEKENGKIGSLRPDIDVTPDASKIQFEKVQKSQRANGALGWTEHQATIVSAWQDFLKDNKREPTMTELTKLTGLDLADVETAILSSDDIHYTTHAGLLAARMILPAAIFKEIAMGNTAVILWAANNLLKVPDAQKEGGKNMAQKMKELLKQHPEIVVNSSSKEIDISGLPVAEQEALLAQLASELGL